MIAWLSTNRERFPPVENALAEPNGLLAAGGDLSSERLIAAYRHGIFPWYSAGQPILWWSPDPRMVLFPAELRISRSLRKTLAKRGYHIRTDACFEDVMQGCAGQRAGREETWITPEMVAAYTALHERGLAHSVETWIDGELAGGLYGVALGRVFYGESMFTRVADASKIALVHLAVQLARWGYGMIDCQMKTAHLARFGAREIARAEFVRRLAELVNYPGITGRWRFDDDLLE
ncbi:MAG: leucyl/phenylalanyl-tRNA--protein transferase [Betaproteobacteria bacterium]|nr:leucyl/phenylalanyl-tRNA--protein transferase [Betaproteobacteria bacterium]